MVAEVGGDLIAAKVRFERALAIVRELGGARTEMVPLTNLGKVTMKLGDLDLSAQYYSDGLLVGQDRTGNRDDRVVTYLLEGVALLAVASGKPWEAHGCWPRPIFAAPRDRGAASTIGSDEYETAVAQIRAVLDSKRF